MTFNELKFEPISCLLARLIKTILGADTPTIKAISVTGVSTAVFSIPGTRVTFFNTTASIIQAKYATGDYVEIPAGGGLTLPVAAASSELFVKTGDASTVTLRIIVENV